MIGELGHQQVEDLLGAYALDAVDADEAALIERHLADCPRCRAEVDAHRTVAGAVGNVVEPVPDDLWDRIAAQLDTAGTGPTPPPLRAVVPAVEPPATVAGTGTGSPVRAPSPARRRAAARWAAAVVAVAALVAVAVLAVGLARADSHVTQLQRQAAGRSSAVEAALRTPGHHVVSLRTPSGGRAAEMVLVPDGRGYMVGSSLPAIRDDETYQLWAQSQGRLISVGLLGPDPRPGGGFTVASTAPSALAITVEPAGGVTTPDRAPVAEATIDA